MKIQHSGGTGTSSFLVHKTMNYQIAKKTKANIQTNKPAYQLPTTVLFLLQLLLLFKFSMLCVVGFFCGVMGCGEQVAITLFSLHLLFIHFILCYPVEVLAFLWTLYCIIYYCVSLQSPSMSEGPLISCYFIMRNGFTRRVPLSSIRSNKGWENHKLKYVKGEENLSLSIFKWPFIKRFEETRLMAIPFTSKFRLPAVSYFSLPSYCTRNPSMRTASPRVAINEGVTDEKKKN